MLSEGCWIQADHEQWVCRPRRPIRQGRAEDGSQVEGPDRQQRGLLQCMRSCSPGAGRSDPPQQATTAHSRVRPQRQLLQRGAASSGVTTPNLHCSRWLRTIGDGGKRHLNILSCCRQHLRCRASPRLKLSKRGVNAEGPAFQTVLALGEHLVEAYFDVLAEL